MAFYSDPTLNIVDITDSVQLALFSKIYIFLKVLVYRSVFFCLISSPINLIYDSQGGLGTAVQHSKAAVRLYDAEHVPENTNCQTL